MAVGLDHARRRAHKLRNVAHSVILVAGLSLLASVIAWILLGPQGVVMAVVGVALALVLGPGVSPELIMRLYRARRLSAAHAPELFAILQALAGRAGLPHVPGLHLIPSPTLNAFAVGSPEAASIAVTSGLLQRLTLREVAGVLAHEVSHIANKDLWIMGLADTLSRLTQMMSFLGIALLILNLPAVLTGAVMVPWTVIALLYFAPTIGSLLQLALSRAREYDADLEAARLTGDPAGLASALEKLERYQGRFWEDIFFPGRRIPQPSLLRTHPPTEERVRRLLELRPSGAPPLTVPDAGRPLPVAILRHRPRPRYHWPGVWY